MDLGLIVDDIFMDVFDKCLQKANYWDLRTRGDELVKNRNGNDGRAGRDQAVCGYW